ncbi:carboxylate-amine ligase [Rhodoferax sp. OV413]|uniref:carboxylate-amine ligase n=1 Tax=Rhodoferax sp. OV413 TaxID=1855285 RepID=UPI000882226C|nr:YbdK family carboxylate-amine ligase [Rhodoferax sp. OV413]SDP11020.1 carboxylate-amine ligase [Rhodoferax sp. OV413]
MQFHHSKALTFGMELELQIVDDATGSLSPSSGELWSELEKLPEIERYALEATLSTIEVTSSIHEDSDEMEVESRKLVSTLKDIAQAKGLNLRGGGTHILQFWNEREFTPTDRAHELESKYGFLPKRFSTYGMHVHVGMPGKAEAIQVANVLQSLTPLFIALSAASPFQQGVDTGFCSARPLEPLVYPYGGPMPKVADWTEFERITDEIFASGLAKSLKDIYWDVRPKPEFGTVEVRVFDTPLRMQKGVSLAALTRGCAALALSGKLQLPTIHIPYNTDRVSRFLACRDGMAARLYNPMAGEWMPAHQWLDQLVDLIEQNPLGAADLRRVRELQGIADGQQDSDIMRSTWHRLASASDAAEANAPGSAAYAANTREHCDRLLS